MTHNLTLIDTTDKEDIYHALRGAGIHGGHFVNGIYSAAADLVVPTTLAAFQYVSDKLALGTDVFVIAVNSNISYDGILHAKHATPEERFIAEKKFSRADKVARPLALQHPDRPVVIMFYDEETPTQLYNSLAILGFRMRSLHKWGYGTNPDAPRIEGAHNFDKVLAFPLLNDIKPVAYDITKPSDGSVPVEVIRLQDTIGPHGAPYITTAGLHFPLLDASMQKYQAKQGGGSPEPAPVPAL